MKYFTFSQPQSKNRVTQAFWARPDFYAQFNFKGHEWLDLNDVVWVATPVYAVEDGIIVTRKNNGAYGHRIDLYCERIWVMFSYCHLSKFKVNTKQKVRAWDLIGYTGNTSTYSMSIHLHFMVKEIDANLDIVEKNNGYDWSLKCWVQDDMFWYEHPRKEYWKIPLLYRANQPTPTRNGMYLPKSHGWPQIRVYPRFHIHSIKRQKGILEHERSHFVYFEQMTVRERNVWEMMHEKLNTYINLHAMRFASEDFSEMWEDFYLNGRRKNKKDDLGKKSEFVIKMMYKYQ